MNNEPFIVDLTIVTSNILKIFKGIKKHIFGFKPK